MEHVSVPWCRGTVMEVQVDLSSGIISLMIIISILD